MEDQSKKTVAIVGAGPSGLVSAKEAIACGLAPTIFEKTGHVGGLWHPQTGGTWNTMKTNLSKYSCYFSDFPWDDSAPDFLSQSQINQYLCEYFAHFKLDKYTHFNNTVEKIEKNSSKWTVTSSHQGNVKSEEFDFVIIASGVFTKPYYPPIPGRELFKGQVLHSGDYKSCDAVKGDNVIVVGGAFSGSELAGDLSVNTNKKVTNIISTPLWVIPRYLPDRSLEGQPQIPIDLVFYTRAKNAASKSVSEEQAIKGRNTYLSSCSKQGEICPELKVEVNSEPRKLTITDNYLDAIKNGRLSVKVGEIVSYDENGLVLKDGSHVPADSVLFSTGYALELPFFDNRTQELLSYQKNDLFQPVLLHKCTFHPDLPNMGFVGIYRGPYFSILELQARWVTLAFSQGGELVPSRETMLEGVEAERKIREKFPRPQFPHGDYVNFADSFAKEINALPDLEKIEKEDPELYKMLWKNALIPAHYRLTGFGKNTELARKEIERLDKFLTKCSEDQKEKAKKDSNE